MAIDSFTHLTRCKCTFGGVKAVQCKLVPRMEIDETRFVCGVLPEKDAWRGDKENASHPMGTAQLRITAFPIQNN